MTETQRRRALAALHGALLGAWWGAWLFALVRVTDRGLWLVDRAVADRAFAFEDKVFPMLASKAGFPVLGNLYVVAFLAVVFGSVLGLSLVAVGGWLGVDPQRESRNALLDVIRSTTFMLASTGVPLALVVAACLLVPEGGLTVAGIFLFVYVLTIPFLAWRRDFLCSARVSPRPVWAWPGWHAFGTVVVIVLVSASLKAIEELAGRFSNWQIELLVELLSTLIGLAFGIAYCAAWIDRVPLSGLWSQRRCLFGWRPLGAMLALEIRIGVIMAWVLAPAFAFVVLSIFVLPQVQEYLKSQGGGLPPWLAQLALLRDSLWYLAMLSAPFCLVALGRLYVRLFPESRRH